MSRAAKWFMYLFTGLDQCIAKTDCGISLTQIATTGSVKNLITNWTSFSRNDSRFHALNSPSHSMRSTLLNVAVRDELALVVLQGQDDARKRQVRHPAFESGRSFEEYARLLDRAALV
ncbi:hypothetical protein MTO96_008310 [Rhipicephalus appendiculatus]